MNIKTFYLNNEKTVYMKAYLLDRVENIEWCKKRPAILILPGGGYEFCSDREAEPVAMRYMESEKLRAPQTIMESDRKKVEEALKGLRQKKQESSSLDETDITVE